MNFIDRTIEWVSPQTALLRQQARTAITYLRGYEAGSWGKRQSKIDRTNTSAVTEALKSLSKLRGFSRQLEMNEPLVKKALRVRTSNIIGSGIRPAIYSSAKRTQDAARELWKAWAETTECDYDGLHNFYGLQAQICTATDRDGECLIIRRRTAKYKTLPFKLQVVEADLLDENKTLQLDTGYIIQGVEFNMDNQRVAYWVYENHPYEQVKYNASISKRIPAEDVIHVFDQQRPGQVRGVPAGVQAFMTLQDLKEYQEAALIHMKIATLFTTTVVSMDGAPKTGAEYARASRMEPGTVTYLQPGEEVKHSTPPTPTGYESYIRVGERKVASAYDITYEALAGDLSTVNFSSGRMGWIESFRYFTRCQDSIYIPRLCDRVFGWVTDLALTTGKLKNAATVTWTPPRREMIDPAKEIKAVIEALKARLISWQEAVRELGWDKEQLLQELIEDRDMWEANEMTPFMVEIKEEIAAPENPQPQNTD